MFGLLSLFHTASGSDEHMEANIYIFCRSFPIIAYFIDLKFIEQDLWCSCWKNQTCAELFPENFC